MKRTKRILFFCCLAAVSAFALLTSSCDLFGVGLIPSLVADLNATPPRDISGNFHPDVSALMTGEGPLSGTILDEGRRPFGITLIGEATGIGDIYQDGTLSCSSPTATYTISFTFRQDAFSNWKILAMSAGGYNWP